MTIKQKGFTLVELMISLLLSTLLIGGVVQLYLSTKSTSTFTRGLARLQDSTSYTFEVMSKDIRMAGYITCGYPESFTNTVSDSKEWWANLHTHPLRGYEGESAILPDYITELNAREESSDVLVVLRSGNNVAAIDTYDNTTNQFFTQRGLSNGWDVNGSLMVACDLRKAVLFQSNKMSAGDVSIELVGRTITDSFGGDAQLSDYTAVIYYVRQSPSENDLSLYRKYVFINSKGEVKTRSEELVEGIENMQLLYGVDRNDDDVSERYLPADLIAEDDWINVVTVRVGLLIASQDGIRDSIGFDTEVYRVVGTDIGPVDSGLDYVYAQDLRKRYVSTMTLAVRNGN